MLRFLAILPLSLLSLIFARAQEDRISARIDDRDCVVLRGNVPPQVAQAIDAGPVPAKFKLQGMTIQFRRTRAQQQALDQLLKDQQDPGSPLYRKWLTPEETADRFGLSRADIARISAWLRSHGLRVGQVARGREWIQFSGTAKQVDDTFHIEIRRYRFENKLHYANNSDPSVSAALGDVVSGVQGLDDFVPSPLRLAKE